MESTSSPPIDRPTHGASAVPTPEPNRISRLAVVTMLPLRLVGFAVFQALFALGFLLQGRQDWWDAAVPWWPIAAVLTNLVTVALLARHLRREGRRFWDLFHVDRTRVRRDVGIVVGLAAISGVLVVAPNFGLATLLFGNAEAPLDTFIQPLPPWAAVSALVLFPVTIALSELAAYFGYIQPRVEILTGRPWTAIGLTAAFLALQHAALPLVIEWRFATWRAVMFLPFALFLGIVLRRRPGLLAYLAILHGLADLQVAFMILSVSL